MGRRFWLAFAVMVSGGCERIDTPLEVETPEVVTAPLPATAAPRPPLPLMPPIPPPPPPRPPPPPPPPRLDPLARALQWYSRLPANRQADVRRYCHDLLANPCLGLIEIRKPSTPPPVLALSLRQRARAADYCHRVDPRVEKCDTPLVVAFDGEPVELVAATGTRFAFTPGAPSASDWPTARTPWIAMDVDGDGAITSGRELFGDATVLPDGAIADGGFAALAALDDNADGVIDAGDAGFSALLLWADADGDRASAPDELRPLAEVVIAIPLEYSLEPRCNDRGACEGERAAMTWRDAAGIRTGEVIDLHFPRR